MFRVDKYGPEANAYQTVIKDSDTNPNGTGPGPMTALAAMAGALCRVVPARSRPGVASPPEMT